MDAPDWTAGIIDHRVQFWNLPGAIQSGPGAWSQWPVWLLSFCLNGPGVETSKARTLPLM